MHKLKVWFGANFSNWWVWRVTYPDGSRTRKLAHAEAKSLKECFGGKLWIDYN